MNLKNLQNDCFNIAFIEKKFIFLNKNLINCLLRNVVKDDE